MAPAPAACRRRLCRSCYAPAMARVHGVFDVARWVREFPLPPGASIDAIRRIIPTKYCSPEEVAGIEQARARFGGAAAMGEGLPTDVCVWGLGEPGNRAATKVGGVPYRPAGAAWPKRKDGAPMGLLAQFCFADSRDIVKAPDDVLLIFAPGDYLVDWDDDEQESLVFEWRPLGLTDLVRPEDVPASACMPRPVYAELHRTTDRPDPPEGHLAFELYKAKPLFIYTGSKIGGFPDWEQAPAELPGRLLCTLGSINPHGERFPLVNVPDPPWEAYFVSDPPWLMMADMGMLHLFVDDDGDIHWTVQGG